ncbi:MAG: Tn7 transposase TnsA N-terminal domain-containing protein [Leptothrix sp. (in: b-proteobacteria)]
MHNNDSRAWRQGSALPEPMARPLGVRGHQREAHTVGSVTMGRDLHLETAAEALIALALDIDPRVVSIRPQPFTVRLDLMQVFATRTEAMAAKPAVARRSQRASEDEVHVYTPDFLVGSDQPIGLVIESKPRAELDRIQTEIAQIRQALCDLGYRFVCVTEEPLASSGMHSNLVSMRDAIHGLARADARQRLQALQDAVSLKAEPMPLSHLRTHLPDDILLMGIACGVLGCDLRQGILKSSTLVWPAHGDLTHRQLLDLEA